MFVDRVFHHVLRRSGRGQALLERVRFHHGELSQTRPKFSGFRFLICLRLFCNLPTHRFAMVTQSAVPFPCQIHRIGSPDPMGSNCIDRPRLPVIWVFLRNRSGLTIQIADNPSVCFLSGRDAPTSPTCRLDL